MQTIIPILTPFLLFLLWQYQAMNEGKEEGLYYSCKNKNIALTGLDEHSFWTIQRVVIAAGFIAQFITYQYYLGATWWLAIILTLALAAAYMLVFSFWHNGKLYQTLNMFTLSGRYTDGWKASIDGKAKNDFTYPQRLKMLVAGWAIFIILTLTEIL